ncbi:Mediator complex subunit Med9 [Penicillium cf. griseofulvum]|uniref:Mediator of RNA polymerase II transcription subunit 9 n=1 Tax=Penicillium cf. griseofulvum TaxID=2972120 RepID=A0A9W9M4M9_9EURO|nr:Mediator complex subunit Med9 [Penicillium cf. griseofulvum]KAJ5434509.1 Mediator complex subunit Med9 [Penicillium cf. griseofulvum]
MASRSPPVGTPLLKSPMPETPFNKDAPTPPQTVLFPSPQTFEIIPSLHGILSRLLSSKGQQPGSSDAPGDTTELPGVSQTQTQQASSNTPNGGHNGNNASSHAVPGVSVLGSSTRPPLDVKTLPTETSSVRIRIQKARIVVEGLPDVHRSVDDQQREIAELEGRVRRLRSVISDFGSRAGMLHDNTRTVEA